MRFQRLGSLYEAPGQTQGIFSASAYSASAAGTTAVPLLHGSRGRHCQLPDRQ